MPFNVTDPAIVMARLSADAIRLTRWAERHGDEKQKQLAFELNIAMDHIAPKFGRRPPGAAPTPKPFNREEWEATHPASERMPAPYDRRRKVVQPSNSESNNDD